MPTQQIKNFGKNLSIGILLLSLVSCFGPSTMEDQGSKSISVPLANTGTQAASFSEVCEYDQKTYTDVKAYLNCMLDGQSVVVGTTMLMECGGFKYDLADQNDANAYVNCKVSQALAQIPAQAPFEKECDGAIYTNVDQWAKCVEELHAQNVQDNTNTNTNSNNNNNNNNTNTNTNTNTGTGTKPDSEVSCKMEGENRVLFPFYNCKNGKINQLFCKYECNLSPCKKIIKFKTSNVREAFDLFAINYKQCQANMGKFPGDPRGKTCTAECKK